MPKKNRSRKVNFEGQQIPKSKLPKGSIFIASQWYSAARKLPAHLKKMVGHLFRTSKGHNYGACKIEADGTLIPINVPVPDTRSVGDLLSDLKRIEKKERQMQGFAKFYWDHVEEQGLGNDKKKAQSYYQECAELFWLPYASYSEYVEAKRLLADKKASLGAALMEKIYYVEEKESGGNHHIALYLQPLSMPLPRNGIEGRWCSQDKYIQLCLDKKEAKSETEMLEKLRNDREDNKGRVNWAEDLTPDGCRWGIDQCNRVLKKESRRAEPFYFAYFKDFPNARTTKEEVNASIEW